MVEICCKQINRGENFSGKIWESQDIKQTTYLQYCKESECLECAKLFDEKRFGGNFLLSTDASEEHERFITRELMAQQLCVAHASKVLAERIAIKHVAVNVIASSITLIEFDSHFSGQPEDDRVSIVVEDKNRERCAAYSVQEIEYEEQNANAYFTNDSQHLIISDYVVQVSRDGGSFILNTYATTIDENILDCWLEKDRLTESLISYTLLTANNEVPQKLATKQSEFETSDVSECIRREESVANVIVTLKASNRGEAQQCRLLETQEYEEITHCQLKRSDAVAIAECTLNEQRYGGSTILETLAASEDSYTTTLCLASKRQSVDGVQITTRIANNSEPIMQKTQASSTETFEIDCSLQKRISSEIVSVTQKAPNSTTLPYNCLESTSIEETTNVQFVQNELNEVGNIVLAEKRFGGNFLLETEYAQELQVNISQTLIARHEETIPTIVITLKMANTIENLLLHTTSSSEATIQCSYHFDKSSQVQRTEHKCATANRVEPLVQQMYESSSVQENTQLNYTKNASAVQISAILPEVRFGGAIRMDAYASEDTTATYQMAIAKKRYDDLSVEMRRTDINTTSPVCLRTIASSEQYITVTVELQNSFAHYSVSQTKLTSRRGNDMSIWLRESAEIDEYTNVQLRREQLHEDVELTLKECRFGGRIQLETKHAQQNDISCIQNLINKQQPTVEVIILRKAINSTQPITAHYKASEDVYAEHNYAIECNRIQTFSVSSIRATPNHESPLCLQTSQSVEAIMTINVYLEERLSHNDSASCTLAEKRIAQGEELRCSAVSEHNIGEVMLSLQRSSAFAQSSQSVRMINKFERQQLQTNASTEISRTLQMSITASAASERRYGATSIRYAIALYGGCIAAKFMATSETRFTAEISYEKQHQNDAKYVVSRHELQEQEHLQQQEQQQEQQQQQQQQQTASIQIEVTEKEMRRRLAEVHIESAIDRATREITPVSLQADRMTSETLIRSEQQLESHEYRHMAEVESEQAIMISESEQIVCTTPVQVELRHQEELRAEIKEEKSEKRVSFAAEVTEKTLGVDMSMTVERREAPSIVKKPMKKESRSRRSAFRQNEAPNFVPMRRNSLLMALGIGSPHNIPHFRTLEDVIKGIKRAGLEYSNLIFGIDYTRSNYYQGEKTFDGKNLHDVNADELNPYQQVIEIVGKTLSSFDADGVIPAYGFGDEETVDQAIFNLYDRDDLDAECNGFEEVLRIYNEKTPFINMSGPTNFVPLIEKAVQIVRLKQSYHILVIVADGQVTNEKINQKAIAAASHYPLSIIMVGVGDGPWSMMTRFDETLPKRMFDNFHFVDFHKVMYNAPNQEASFALNALMEIPDQYKAIKELGLLKYNRRG